jgi:hypothetical protein
MLAWGVVEMGKSAGAPVQINSGLLKFLAAAGMLLTTALIAEAQSTPANKPPASVRDRLLGMKPGAQLLPTNAVPFGGAIDATGNVGKAGGSPAANANRGVTVPYWTDSFSYQGLTYKYSMVGTDPRRGSVTTTVPTVIIPMRFVFENGVVFDATADSIDGQTSTQGIIKSPVFQNYAFTPGGTRVGNTQYADAFQRANFWDAVSKRSPDYHVLLGQPTVTPAYEVFVPITDVAFHAEGNGQFLAAIEESFLEQATADAVNANVSPDKLVIVNWGDVSGTLAGGFHRSQPVPGGTQTYVATGYHARLPVFRYPDIHPLSHEVIEWLDDPFGDNFTPGWNPVFNTYPHCISDPVTADELEVGDVLEFTPLGSVPVNTATGFTIYRMAHL